MSIVFTDRQLDVMSILWDRGSATVREARGEMDGDPPYTTVLTIFQTLEKNGQVRYEEEGRAYRYYPTVSREEAGREAAEHVLERYFGGSAAALVRTILETRDLDEAEAGAIRETLGRQETVAA